MDKGSQCVHLGGLVALFAALSLFSGCFGQKEASQARSASLAITHGHLPFTDNGIKLVYHLYDGQWESDHDGTMSWVKSHRSYSKQKMERYDRLFGHAVARWTPAEFQFSVPGGENTTPYHILAANDQQIVVQIMDPELGREVFGTIDFDEDHEGYWVYVPQHDMKEHFVHLMSTEAKATPSPKVGDDVPRL